MTTPIAKPKRPLKTWDGPTTCFTLEAWVGMPVLPHVNKKGDRWQIGAKIILNNGGDQQSAETHELVLLHKFAHRTYSSKRAALNGLETHGWFRDKRLGESLFLKILRNKGYSVKSSPDVLNIVFIERRTYDRDLWVFHSTIFGNQLKPYRV